ncbi:hypothetical protein FOTG_18770 [Fusarium oxysporum f. sp. vasinfectum 25433]|uniref:Uncharacterized protein n=1 Tax=Fusarium oxysporum f. sp. vasinfectum 25433 TaxID=1089449 RepID=X0LW77_FUSOX|nr:hypothetical protein FOTG_18770 [Fusarium oxysporum f. sp. vasinfectum 25433]
MFRSWSPGSFLTPSSRSWTRYTYRGMVSRNRDLAIYRGFCPYGVVSSRGLWPGCG